MGSERCLVLAKLRRAFCWLLELGDYGNCRVAVIFTVSNYSINFNRSETSVYWCPILGLSNMVSFISSINTENVFKMINSAILCMTPPKAVSGHLTQINNVKLVLFLQVLLNIQISIASIYIAPLIRYILPLFLQNTRCCHLVCLYKCKK